MPHHSDDIKAYALFLVALFLVIASWYPLSTQHAHWINTPPVPGEHGAVAFSIGDKQMAYRGYSLMLQNIGNIGGESTALQDYDFDKLGAWFWLQHSLDPRSDYMPVLAAYYFGGTENPEQLDPVIDYLGTIGQSAKGQKWRWLAHAVYLARFKQNDLDKALELAHILASMQGQVALPQWATHMPAFINAQKGDKEAALQMLVGILKEEAETMHPNEVNFTVSYICERVLSPEEAALHPLCLSSE